METIELDAALKGEYRKLLATAQEALIWFGQIKIDLDLNVDPDQRDQNHMDPDLDLDLDLMWPDQNRADLDLDPNRADQEWTGSMLLALIWLI